MSTQLDGVITLSGVTRIPVHGTRERNGVTHYLLDANGSEAERAPRARVDKDGRVWSFKPRGFEFEDGAWVKRVSLQVTASSLQAAVKEMHDDMQTCSAGSSSIGMVFLVPPDGKREIARSYVDRTSAVLKLQGVTVGWVDSAGAFHHGGDEA
jgi:hypothetical protein